MRPNIFSAFTFEDGPEKKYEAVLKKFEEYFVHSEILFTSEHVFIHEYRGMEKIADVEASKSLRIS